MIKTKRILESFCLTLMAGGILAASCRKTQGNETQNHTEIILWNDSTRAAKSALGAGTYSDRQSFPYYLMKEAEQHNFLLAKVAVKEEQGEFCWIYEEDKDALAQQYKSAKAEWLAQEEEEKADYWLFMKLKKDDVHDLDIWYGIKEAWDAAAVGDDGVSAFTDESGFCDISYSDGSNRCSAYIKDDFLYVLECVDNRFSADETISETSLYFYYDYMRNYSRYLSLWMSDENFYWRDHKDRVLHMENPDRTFYQAAGKDFSEGDRPYGILKKAEYTLALSEHTPAVNICLTLEQPLKGVVLTDWGPADYTYSLEVSDAKTNELLLKDSVWMSADIVDSARFVDQDGDGYLEMQIAYPDHHWVSELDYLEYIDRQAASEPQPDPRCEYYISNTPECWFLDYSYGDDIPKIYSFAKIYEKTEDTAQPEDSVPKEQDFVTVQPGDTLWKIAEKYFGDGRDYRKLYIRNRDVIGDDPDMLLPGMRLYVSH